MRVMVLGTFLALAAGCTSMPRYETRASWLHKDLLAVTVYVHERLNTPAYVDVAFHETLRLPARGPDPEIPLYMVRFDFRLVEEPPGDRVGTRKVGPRAPTKLVAQVFSRPGARKSTFEVVLY